MITSIIPPEFGVKGCVDRLSEAKARCVNGPWNCMLLWVEPSIPLATHENGSTHRSMQFQGHPSYFWRCLCFGLEQITMIFPFLRIKEQLSQIFRTEGRTFIFFSQFLMIFSVNYVFFFINFVDTADIVAR